MSGNIHIYSVYLCGPISGLTWEEATGWRKLVHAALGDDIEVLSPLRDKDFLADVGVLEGSYEENIISTARGVVTRDLYDTRRADVLLAYFPYRFTPSIGTPFEMGYAAALNKPIIVVMHPDDPLRKHPFIEHLPHGVVVATLDEAIAYVGNLFNLIHT